MVPEGCSAGEVKRHAGAPDASSGELLLIDNQTLLEQVPGEAPGAPRSKVLDFTFGKFLFTTPAHA